MAEQKKETLRGLIEKHYLFLFICVLIIAALNIFFNISGRAVQDWDEARHGVSACEIVKNGSWIKTTYEGSTDYWNLKPPLGLWLIAVSYKIFGFNTFALRFPSALSAFLCVFFLMRLAASRCNKITAIFSGLILSTAFAFIQAHSARNGDFDAQLALVLLLAVFFLDKMKDNKYYFTLGVFMAALAFLLKSFAFIPVLSVIIISLIFMEKKSRPGPVHYLTGAAVFILPIAAWGFARFSQDGFEFFQRMISYDLFRRSLEPLEGHSSSNLFYLEVIFLKFIPWALFFLVFPFYKNRIYIRKENSRNRIRFQVNGFYQNPIFWIWILVPLAIVLFIKTKNEWYMDPLYPAFSLWLGWHISDLLNDSVKKGFFGRLRLMLPALVLSFFIIAESAILIVDGSPILQIALNKRASFPEMEKILEKQVILKSIPAAVDKSPVEIYSVSWEQADIFIMRVLKNIRPVLLNNNEAYAALHNENRMLMIENTLSNADIVQSDRLDVILSNRHWLVAK